MGFFEDVAKNEFKTNTSPKNKKITKNDIEEDTFWDKDNIIQNYDEYKDEEDYEDYEDDEDLDDEEDNDYSDDEEDEEEDEEDVEDIVKNNNFNKPSLINKEEIENIVRDNVNMENMVKDNKEELSTLSIGILIEGDIKTKDSIIISGTVNGNVYCEKDVTVLRDGVVNGEIHSDNNVIVCGKVSGDIWGQYIKLDKTKIRGKVSSTGALIIEKDTIIIGDISADNLVIHGAINGEIFVNNHVDIKSTAIIKGNIKSKTVHISEGAAIEGICTQCYANTNPTSFFNNIE